MAILLTEVRDRIGTITLNRPERRNALNGALVAALDGAVKQMAADDDVRVVVLTGSGPEGEPGGGFCSGGDTKRDDRGTDDGMELGVPPDALSGDLARHDLHASMLLHTMPKPTIAMIGGPAVGAGCSLAAACDLRFMSSTAVLAANFTANGLAGDYGGTFLWTRIAGTATTRRMYLLNEKLSAAEAERLGLVHVVADPGALVERTMEAAAGLARMPRDLMALVKQNLNEAEDEADRRRYLFALEAENQAESGRNIMRRVARARERSPER
ncbi:MAG: enoyl-CoA hydratase-related protein [Actinomycetota bacterium]|nr:enoyl-CoA hydratase-related protein [Actinomycetota bacterium]